MKEFDIEKVCKEIDALPEKERPTLFMIGLKGDSVHVTVSGMTEDIVAMLKQACEQGDGLKDFFIEAVAPSVFKDFLKQWEPLKEIPKKEKEFKN